MSEFKQSTQFDAAGARFRTGGLLGKSRFYSDSSRCSQVRFRIHRAKTRFSGFRMVFTKACDHNFAGFACCTDTVSKNLTQLCGVPMWLKTIVETPDEKQVASWDKADLLWVFVFTHVSIGKPVPIFPRCALAEGMRA
ncbi:hypothetical protein HGG72_01870 [Ochrobactrum pecoris]|uniref:Uncharacterized protein n=1 Tax=Brucella pecoris TaxID=867683 RepID=A0A5C5CN34_9HYPH|nr:hypothetical protein [Brucella pecoris]MBB4093856.1 hypothetical protein [Brucella pecoris]NKW79358.1 hypothetical protein [Brucella pecoris]TNV12773.1 hypothetical protein FIB18_09505 [Brucella pecoris]